MTQNPHEEMGGDKKTHVCEQLFRQSSPLCLLKRRIKAQNPATALETVPSHLELVHRVHVPYVLLVSLLFEIHARHVALAIFIQLVSFALSLTLVRDRSLLFIGLLHWSHIRASSRPGVCLNASGLGYRPKIYYSVIRTVQDG